MLFGILKTCETIKLSYQVMRHVLLSFLPWYQKYLYHFMICVVRYSFITVVIWNKSLKRLVKEWTAMFWLLMGKYGVFCLVISRFHLSIELGTRDGKVVQNSYYEYSFWGCMLLSTFVSSWSFCSLLRRKWLTSPVVTVDNSSSDKSFDFHAFLLHSFCKYFCITVTENQNI